MDRLSSIALVSNYLPRKCGISTFAGNLFDALRLYSPERRQLVVAVANQDDNPAAFPDVVACTIAEQEGNSYRRAADFLNVQDVDAVLVQHEYGIYGGPAGAHLLHLMRSVEAPIVTTCHTILERPTVEQRRVMDALVDLSARVVVMSERGAQLLGKVHGVPQHKVDIIPHGIPDMPFIDSSFLKDRFDLEGRVVALTFGLLSPNKGIEYVLQAMPTVIEQFPHFKYVNLLKSGRDEYREYLTTLTVDLGLSEHVHFENRFVEHHELIDYLSAADVYITPYLDPSQITSGTLAYAFGCGKPVIATPYAHAAELLAEGRGVLTPFRNAEAMGQNLLSLLSDEARRTTMRRQAYSMGRQMVWSEVAKAYEESLSRATRREVTLPRTSAVRRHGVGSTPAICCEHLLHMTDSTGLLQHATHSLANYREGYCTDDNARALSLMVLLEQLPEVSVGRPGVEKTYAAFLDYAFVRETGRFRNFMAYDRTWCEAEGSDDSQGRAVGALAFTIANSRHAALRKWAAPLLPPAALTISGMSSPRAWAFALIGSAAYLEKFPGDRKLRTLADELLERLLRLHASAADGAWNWFEPVVSYDNARLPQALLAAGRVLGRADAVELGLETLEWLATAQVAKGGYFHPVGSNGFWRKGEPCALFDQQPLEAAAMVSAAIEAHRNDPRPRWLSVANVALRWFFGANSLGVSLYDRRTGGCADGLEHGRLNANQGAESTLACLTALAEFQLLQNRLATRDELGLHPPINRPKLQAGGALLPETV